MSLLIIFLISFFPLIANWVGNNKTKQGKRPLGWYKTGITAGFIVLGLYIFTLIFTAGKGEGNILSDIIFIIMAIPPYIGLKKCKEGKNNLLNPSDTHSDNSDMNSTQGSYYTNDSQFSIVSDHELSAEEQLARDRNASLAEAAYFRDNPRYPIVKEETQELMKEKVQKIFCPNCGADIPDGADHCEYCETKF